MFENNRRPGLGIIIGETRDQFLSFDDYAEHFLLPFSPRFRNIDFAVSTLVTAGVESIVVLVKRDKEIILNYLVKGWPRLSFHVLDYVDIMTKFMDFLDEFTQAHSMDRVLIVKGNHPVWLDLDRIRDRMDRAHNLSLRGRSGGHPVYPLLAVERKLFQKKVEVMILDEKNLDMDVIEKMTREFRIPEEDLDPTTGYVLPFGSLKDYYRIHMDMIGNYLELDEFHSRTPIRGDSALTVSSQFGKSAFVSHSIVGENVEILGRVENSVIFSGVKIGKNAFVKDSLVFPGNHVGSKCRIIKTIVDEFSGDSTIPNIGPNVEIGLEDTSVRKNAKFPSILNFGVTLVGKDARIPPGARIGANCYIDSFVPASSVKTERKIADGVSVLREC